MTDAIFLALAYLRYNAAKTAVLVVAIALIVAAPAAVSMFLDASERRLAERAQQTPLVVGARGSRLDLVMSALYFTDDRPATITQGVSEEIWDSGLGEAYPIHARFTASGAPLVGVSIDYFDFRGLRIAEGRSLAVLGEAVLGADVAARLGLGPGDVLFSDPENLFDLAGVYPLLMNVVGVFAPTGGPDDRAVFIDLRTAWVIEGIGHGHEDVLEGTAIGQDAGALLANPAITQYAEITPENIDSFHFHGDPSGFPVSAVVVAPFDHRSATVLRGRYLEDDQREQVVEPETVMQALLESVFRIKRVLDAVMLVIGVGAVVAIGLAVFLSVALRRGEIETAFKLGGRRAMIARLITAESLIVLCLAGGLASLLILGMSAFADDAALLLLSAV